MNGPPDLPTDTIPMPVPEPAVPLPPVRTPVAAEPPPGEPAAEAGPAVGAPAPQPRWVGEAVRDLFTVSRKKLVVLTTAGSVVAVGLALNALFTGAGLAPPETPSTEQSAEPKSLATAPAELQTRESAPATIPPEPLPVRAAPVVYTPPLDLREPAPSAPPATGGDPAPDIPVVPEPAPPAGGSGGFVAPSPILPATYTEPATVTPAAPTPPGGVSLPAPTLPPGPSADPMTTPAKPEPKSEAPASKPLEVALPTVPAVGPVGPPSATGGATRPNDKSNEPAAKLEPKGVLPVTPLPEPKTPADPMLEEKKDSGLPLPFPPPQPVEGIALPDRTPAPTTGSPAAGQVAAPGDLPARVITPAEGGRLPEPRDVTPPSPFKPVPAAGDDKPVGGSLNLTKPPGELGARPAGNAEPPPKTDFDVDLHRPKASDTYESISKLHYRDARYANALREFNEGVGLDRGGDVQVPPMYVLRQRYSQLIGAARSPASSPEWAPPAGRERK